MSVELLYTSAPKGLRQGSRGFCTVLSTAGMPINLATRLESLSGYKQLYATDSPQASSNPVAFSHLKFTLSGQPTSVVSRVSAYGADYSGRTNKLAHHIVVNPDELPAAGPAWLLQEPGVMRTQWDGTCATPASGPVLPRGDQVSGVCQLWKSITGDAGWGGVVAEAFLKRSAKPTWIIYSIEQRDQLLPLINEAIALLPPDERWNATFSTYAAQLAPDVDCRVRCVVRESEEAKFARARGQVIELVAKPLSLTSGVVAVARGDAHAMGSIEDGGRQSVKTAAARPRSRASNISREPARKPRNPQIPPSLTETAPAIPELPASAKQSKNSTIAIAFTVISVGVLIVVIGLNLLERSRSSVAKIPTHVEPNPPSRESVDPPIGEPDAPLSNPTNDETSTNEPETQKPETQKPETQKPETQKPETQKPETQKPETQKPETQKPETQKPETQKPETQETNAGGPQVCEFSEATLTLDSMLSGQAEVRLILDDDRLDQIDVHNVKWSVTSDPDMTRPKETEEKTGFAWLPTQRVYKFPNNDRADYSISAAISKSDRKLFARVLTKRQKPDEEIGIRAQLLSGKLEELHSAVRKARKIRVLGSNSIPIERLKQNSLNLPRGPHKQQLVNICDNVVDAFGRFYDDDVSQSKRVEMLHAALSDAIATATKITNAIDETKLKDRHQHSPQYRSFAEKFRTHFSNANRGASTLHDEMKLEAGRRYKVDAGIQIDLFEANQDSGRRGNTLLVIPIKFTVVVTRD